MKDERNPKPDNVSGFDAEFAGLEAEAAKVDGAIAAVPAEQQAAQDQQAAQNQANEVQEMATILQMCASLFFPLFPSLQPIYTPETCQSLAGALIPVMAKRGWSVAGITAGWGEEIALAIVAIPIGIATSQAVKADMVAAELKAKAEKAKEPETAQVVAMPETPAPSANEPNFSARG